ncbi:MAG TPA: flagellar basal body L-ring protein FlgH [Sphingomonas sp.]|nr:flagellar basal body L-ring protein FlgH [Sphingomonas sp.]
MTPRSTLLPLLAIATLLPACGTIDQLKTLGRAPPLSKTEAVDSPDLEESLGQHRRGAGPAPVAAAAASASLFRAGAGAFLGDQRAARVGDILTVRINVADKADIGNSTARSRGGDETAGVTSLLGLEKLLPGDPATLAATNSTSEFNGSGTISRSETINLTMSGIVTAVLPNGNLTIRGRQEIRVNYELRELIVTGIVRPQDIARDNSIRHSQIAEARISYGGRGQLSQAQQARWGQQIYDALFPF